MKTNTVGETFKAAIIAGLVAGLVVAVFHLIFTERFIDMAIAHEEAMAQAAGEHGGEDAVPRDLQKSLGLVSGFVAYGLFLSLIYAVAFLLVQRALPAQRPLANGAALAGIAYWHLALFPFLKYPANPPAVGDPDTIAQRQGLFLAAMALALLGTLLAFGMNAWLKRSFGITILQRGAIVLACYAAYTLAIFLVLPSVNDPIAIPLEVVLNFRMLSLLGLTIFWAALGGMFGLIIGRRREYPSAPPFDGAQDRRGALVGEADAELLRG